jgi:hypothetical protein
MKTIWHFGAAAAMSLGLLAGLAFAGAVPLLAEDPAVQTGTWEFKMTGFPMDGVPAAMRAQMEAEMSKPFRSCVTAEDIRKLHFGKVNDDDDEDCKVVSSKLTRTGGEVVRQCTGDESRTETIHLETPTPQTLRATITKKDGDRTSTMTVTGKWLNSTCQG